MCERVRVVGMRGAWVDVCGVPVGRVIVPPDLLWWHRSPSFFS